MSCFHLPNVFRVNKISLTVGGSGFEVVDNKELTKQIVKKFRKQELSVGQRLSLEHKQHSFRLIVTQISTTDNANAETGTISKRTKMVLDRIGQVVNFNLGDADNEAMSLGIGGQTEVLVTLVESLVSRLADANLYRRLNIQHVRGFILHGPPGTGKTLLLRKLAEITNAKEFKVVSSADLLSKWYGKSEANVKKLFASARSDYQKYGEKSPLHMIVIDEIDAIARIRSGGNDGGDATNDRIVNQLLTEIDGVDRLNNVLLFATTNRLDIIDESFLRPGRFEFKLKMGLPTLEGRLQILKVHAGLLLKENMLDANVDLQELAQKTPNCSGADLQGLVNGAIRRAMLREAGPNLNNIVMQVKVTHEDLVSALQQMEDRTQGSSSTVNRGNPEGM